MLDTHHSLPVRSGRRSVFRRAFPVACALAAGVGTLQSCAAAEIDLAGVGTFGPPSAEQLARLPAGVAFSRADLSSGTWSFLVRYEDQTADADPDPYVGRYVGAIRVFRLTVGATTVDFPANQAQLVISDGGLGFPDRESIRVEASTPTSYGLMTASWIQGNQTSTRTDLRGAPGSLASDAIPAPPVLAHLSDARPFDRFLFLRIDGPAGPARPFLYLTSSKVSVVANPAAIK